MATPGAAFAKKKGKHGSVHAARTAGGSSKRIAIMGADVKPSEDKPVRAQLGKILKKHKIKVAAKPRKGEVPSDEQAWMALGLKLKVDGFLVPAYDRAKKKRSVEIVVRTARDGSVVATETFSAKGSPKKLAAAIGKGFWKQLGSSLEQVSAPAPGQEGTGMPARDLSREPAGEEPSKPVADAESAPASSPTEAPPSSKSDSPAGAVSSEETPAPDEPSTAAAPAEEERAGAAKPASASTPTARHTESGPAIAGSPRGPKLPALSVRLVGRFVSRTFAYTSSSGVPDSSVATPSIGAAASWFPITFVGLAVSGEFASWTKLASRYPTVSSDLTGALVVRIPLSFGEITGHAGAFRHVFAIQDDGTRTRTDQVVPDLVYVGLRAGAGVTYHVTESLTAAAEASYRLITDMNGGAYAVTSSFYFPKAAPGPGLDLGVTVSYRITPALEALAGFDVRRYVLTTSGNSTTPIDATYLTDQSLAGWIGVGAVFGGT